MLARYLAQNARGKPVRYALDPAHARAVSNYMALLTRGLQLPQLARQAAPQMSHPTLHPMLAQILGGEPHGVLGPFLDLAADTTPHTPGTSGHGPLAELLNHLHELHEQGLGGDAPPAHILPAYHQFLFNQHPALASDSPLLRGGTVHVTPAQLLQLINQLRQHPIRSLWVRPGGDNTGVGLADPPPPHSGLLAPLLDAAGAPQSRRRTLIRGAFEEGRPQSYIDLHDLLGRNRAPLADRQHATLLAQAIHQHVMPAMEGR